MPKASPVRGTQLIARSAVLLRLIANANHQGARLVDLTYHSGLERTTVRMPTNVERISPMFPDLSPDLSQFQAVQ